jgi:hypothetical protein
VVGGDDAKAVIEMLLIDRLEVAELAAPNALLARSRSPDTEKATSID